MGLGKTLTMISLAATDLDSDMNNSVHMDIDDEQDNIVPTTLVIVPPPRRLISPLSDATC